MQVTSVDLEEYAENHPTNQKPVKEQALLVRQIDEQFEGYEGFKERRHLTQASVD